jgi:excisionase family DNA binding protein
MIEPAAMNKKEVANLLGKSVRAVQRYTSDGKLTVKYVQGKNGLEAIYNEAEARRLKAEIETPVYQVKQADPGTPTDSTALTRATLSDLERVTSMAAITFGERMVAAVQALKPTQPAALSIADKLTLTLQEAATLSGLSRNWLIDAIKAQRLKAAKRGRGWNIKRADLDAYVRKL